MERRPERRVPRAAGRIVALIALGSALFLVSLAWRSSRGVSSSSESGPSPIASPGAGGSSGAFVECATCHKDLDKVFREGRAKLLVYTHKKHFAQGVSDCAMCHAANTHEADKINKPTMERCFMCHGRDKTAIAPGSCETCHPPGSPAEPSSHGGNWLRQHGAIAKEDPFQCTTCHEEKTCTACHTLPMPHPDDWKGGGHVDTFFQAGANTCNQCHRLQPAPGVPRDFCDSCHHPIGPENSMWRRYHPNVVKQEGATECFQCHNPITCATCHMQGKQDLSADKDYKAAYTPAPSPGGA